ncbi:DEAD/DEAH box helicase [Methanobacterium formicicum]|uniref:DEAD/DEAH box helicase n=1 Tax=Methanobacterium formicicum TaxID=2162 RepID=UPI002FE1C164
MEIGDKVISTIYPEKKEGSIVEINSIDGTKYYKVYFGKTNESIILEDKDVKKVLSPTERIRQRKHDHHLLFPLRILSEKLDSLAYQDKIISANNFNIIPLPHQVLTVNHVLEQFKPRCLIADEVGLGKTIEAALIFEELKMRKMVERVLIVVPSGLAKQWKDELQTKFNEEFILIDRSSLKALKEVHGDSNVWMEYDRIITSIDFVKPKITRDYKSAKMNESIDWHNTNVSEDCAFAQWDMVIFDEAHKLSKSSDGQETARYKIGKELSEKTPILLLLTATPHQGDSERFRHLLRLIDEYKFYAVDSLNSDNVKSVTIKNQKRAVTDFDGNLIFKSRIVSMVKIPRDDNDIEAELYDKVSNYVSKYYNLASREGNFPFMFLLILYQRMVSSSSRAIHNSLEKRLNLLRSDFRSAKALGKMDIDDLRDVDGQEVYDEIIDYQSQFVEQGGKGNYRLTKQLKEEMGILEDCVSVAKKAAYGRQDFKVRKLLEIIQDTIQRERNPQTKFIIFTEFIDTQYYIGEILESLGYKVTFFNGRMSLEEKIESKSRFSKDYQFLISTDSGGEGINLQFCHVMINYDLPWNPMKIEQRIGRVDRIGQEKDVLIFNFLLENTVEERVREILDHKLDLIADEFGDDKKKDVLSFLQDEYNFEKIFIEAIRDRELRERELERTGSEMYIKAKEILEKQDLLVPFTEEEDPRSIVSCMVEDEKTMVKRLIEIYADFKNVELKEYSKQRNVYYFEHSINDMKLRNIVFERDLAIKDEKYEYINLNHPLVKEITNEMLDNDSLSFDLEIEGYNQNVKGTLFFYRLELTNNEGFHRRHLIPIFINQRGTYDPRATVWFENNYDFKFDVDHVNDMGERIEILKEKAESVRNTKIKELMVTTKLELMEKIEKEQEKFERYFQDKEMAIHNISIDNIREYRLNELEKQRNQERLDLNKKKNLVPIINLFAVAEVTLKP